MRSFFSWRPQDTKPAVFPHPRGEAALESAIITGGRDGALWLPAIQAEC